KVSRGGGLITFGWRGTGAHAGGSGLVPGVKTEDRASGELLREIGPAQGGVGEAGGDGDAFELAAELGGLVGEFSGQGFEAVGLFEDDEGGFGQVVEEGGVGEEAGVVFDTLEALAGAQALEVALPA